MVPIHYFLALLAILLSISGCTQKAPPGTRQSLDTTQQIGTDVNDEPTQVINHGGNGGNVAEPTVKNFKIEEASGGNRWEITIAGDDASNLYNLLEVEPKYKEDRKSITNEKSGVNIECTEAALKKSIKKVRYQCSLQLGGSDGELKKYNKRNDLKLDVNNAGLVLDQQLKSSYFELDVASASGKYGRLKILGDEAKKIIESLSVEAKRLDNKNGTHDRVAKRGKNVNCLQHVWDSNNESYFECMFYFDYNSGNFEEISVDRN